MWDQTSLTLNKTPHCTIDGGNVTEAVLNGFATSGSCFKVIADFPQNTECNAAYRACEQ